MWAIYAGVGSRRSEDVGPDPAPPPAAVATLLAELAARGFERLGEVRTVLPRSVVALDWLMVDPSGATVAAVTPVRAWALLICASSFADRTWLQTYYPRVETIDT